MKFKAGVKLEGITPEALLGLIVSEQAFKATGTEMVITSVKDGVHKVGSKHYEGKAFDLRTKATGLSRRIAQGVKDLLAPVGYDVILEDVDQDNEHLHVEYDPKA
jgi:hypothetical protein